MASYPFPSRVMMGYQCITRCHSRRPTPLPRAIIHPQTRSISFTLALRPHLHLFQSVWKRVRWTTAERVCYDIFHPSYIRFPLTRRADFKNKGGFKQDDLRRRREEQQVEIRRQKREENITKRRNFLPSAPDSDDDGGGSGWQVPVSAPSCPCMRLEILNITLFKARGVSRTRLLL